MQWDEPAVVHEVQDTVETGLLLPRLYIYPLLRYDLAMLALVPDLVRLAVAHREKFGSGSRQFGAAIKAGLREVTASHAFMLRLRRVFFVVSLTTAVFTYLAVFVWRRRWSEALLAAALVALSWEVHYQIRWIGADGLMMAAAALGLLFLALAWRDRHPRWVLAGAAAAGIGCSAKYPVALLLVPFLIVAAQRHRDTSGGARWRLVAKAVLVFAATYLVLSPGTVLEPWRFAGDVMGIVSIYQMGKQANYAVAAGPEHLWLTAVYLAEVLFSRYAVVSAAVTIAAAAGAVAIVREGRPAVAFLAFPVTYVAFLSAQRTMVVRNLLPLVPFLAVMAARGWSAGYEAVKHQRWAAPVAGALAAAALAASAIGIVTAAQSIPRRGGVDWSAEVRRYIADRPGVAFSVSPRVAELLRGGGFPGNVVFDLQQSQRAVLFTGEAERYALPGNRRGTYTSLPAGPFEVNLDYYPHWIAFDRIVVVDPSTARRIGVSPVARSDLRP